MKVLLLNPPFKLEHGRFSRTSRSPAITKSGTIYYPFWLAYATGVLEDGGFEVKLLDAPAEGFTLKEVIEAEVSFRPDLVIVETSTPSLSKDFETVSQLKKASQDLVIVVVGTHPSALPQETLGLCSDIDAVAIGEYDFTVRNIAQAIDDGKGLDTVQGIVWRNGTEIIQNPPRRYIKDLDSLPFVSSVYKKHLDYKKYFFAAAKYPMVMIITGRGCPFKCFFCVYPQTFHGRQYRLRSPENVVEEFEYIVTNFKEVREIGIEDDTFTANTNRVHKICELLISRDIHKKIRWWANARVHLDFDTMKIMKKAGCRLLITGFESGSQKVLDNMKKGISIQQSYDFAQNARRVGLLVHGCFMFGNPGETEETVLETIEFAKKLPIDQAQFFPLIPYPGTKAYSWARENKFLCNRDYEGWLSDEGLHNCVIETPELAANDILSWCARARREYYLRPKYIAKKIFQSLSDMEEGRRNIKSFMRFARFLFSN